MCLRRNATPKASCPACTVRVSRNPWRCWRREPLRPELWINQNPSLLGGPDRTLPRVCPSCLVSGTGSSSSRRRSLLPWAVRVPVSSMWSELPDEKGAPITAVWSPSSRTTRSVPGGAWPSLRAQWCLGGGSVVFRAIGSFSSATTSQLRRGTGRRKLSYWFRCEHFLKAPAVSAPASFSRTVPGEHGPRHVEVL